MSGHQSDSLLSHDLFCERRTTASTTHICHSAHLAHQNSGAALVTSHVTLDLMFQAYRTVIMFWVGRGSAPAERTMGK